MSAQGHADRPELPRRTAAVVTVSDGVSAGVRDDASGRAVVALLEANGFDVIRHEVVPDERDRIASLLAELADAGAALVATTGGTGLGPRDVTPEATRDVIDREAPGLAEEMRASGRASTPFAALSRGVAGSRGAGLILNLPGSERGATESLAALLPVLPHALDLLAGDTVHGPADAPRPAGHRHGQAPPAPGGGPEAELAARRARGEPVVLATAVRAHGTPPCRVGQKVLLGSAGPIAGTLGCAEFDAAALEGSRAVLAAGTPETRTFEHDLGSIEVYLEPSPPRPLLVVVSATPVAAALLRWGPEVGFDAVLVEPRAGRPGGLSLPPRTRVTHGLGAALGDREAYAVLTDHDAPGVAENVAALLRAGGVRFVGVMGSARHVGPHLDRLRAMGFGEDDLARVRTPVGLDLGGRTAEEIALSILAGALAARNDRDGGFLDRRSAAEA